MKAIISVFSASAVLSAVLFLTSCGSGCCTGEAPVKPLRPLPTFGFGGSSK